MNVRIIVAILVTFVPLLLNASEPSAFGAGNLNNESPYGLTPSEEIILQNKKNLKKVLTSTSNQANQVDSLRERIDGLQSIVESMGIKAHENKRSIAVLMEQDNKSLENADLFEKRVLAIVDSNTQSLDQMKIALAELSKAVDKIQGTYVHKDEFNALIDDVNKFKELVSKELQGASKTTSAPSKSPLESMASAEVYNKAKAFYDKKYYTDAIIYYKHLIDKNYKPAYSHYMIGNMYYKRKNFADAIAYFKKSASLYSKASYMPELILYTAISMQETGDLSNAKSFYDGVVAKYPNTSEAKEAKKRLQTLN
ncbi:MAG: tetratricopeptide repeat protein [Sulfurimonas sp.]|jgi:TolA-binding protein|nr:tetratricopeptide repeat protein [Sulfurimonas sp.]